MFHILFPLTALDASLPPVNMILNRNSKSSWPLYNITYITVHLKHCRSALCVDIKLGATYVTAAGKSLI